MIKIITYAQREIPLVNDHYYHIFNRGVDSGQFLILVKTMKDLLS